uniref:Uncharacterized protein n=1 Tax=Panagrolaimus sp. JU765 TaxID=591449 RepID=A0AC34Q5Y3_9BILA
MEDFDYAKEDYFSLAESPEFDVSESQQESGDFQINTMQRSAFHFDNFHEFINDPQIITSIIYTVLAAILIPVLGGICYRIFKMMTAENLFCETIEKPISDKLEVPNEQESESEPDEPEPPKLIDTENLKPADFLEITDEERILLNATFDADDQDYDTLKALNRVKLHGKLATAQLRAKTQKIENEMTAEEREQERIIRNEQLAKIFAMMEQQTEKFGIQSEDDLKEQLKLYSV